MGIGRTRPNAMTAKTGHAARLAEGLKSQPGRPTRAKDGRHLQNRLYYPLNAEGVQQYMSR